jgi:hypothetical protein
VERSVAKNLLLVAAKGGAVLLLVSFLAAREDFPSEKSFSPSLLEFEI